MAHKGNINNLKPVRSKEEATERGRKGGIRSGEVRMAKKLMKDVLIDLLNLPLKNEKIDEFNSLLEIKGKNITAQQAIGVAMIKKAMSGDVPAAVFVRDTSGNKPKEDEGTNDVLTAFAAAVVAADKKEKGKK